MPNKNRWENAVQWLRKNPGSIHLVRECYYDDPLINAAERYWKSYEWQSIRTLLQGKSGNALDVGAGRGISSYALARDGFNVTALEPNTSKLVGSAAIRQLAKESNLKIVVEERFSEKLPFPDQSFDLVFARAVLHHTVDLRAACSEFLRVLKPSGRFIAVREHVISQPEDLEVFLEDHPLHYLYGGENAFLLGDYETSIREAGFKIDQVIGPLESAINFAPHTLQSLQQEIAVKATRNIPLARDLVRIALGIPGVWSIAKHILKSVDHRPGRLYSFVAIRPN